MHQKPQPWFRQTALKRKLTTFIHEKPVLLHAKAFDQKTPERLRKSRAIMQSNAVNTFSICAAQTREEPSMKIGIGNDHAAVELKNIISEHLKERGCEVVNFGTDTSESFDYPIAGYKVGKAVANGDVDLGILAPLCAPSPSAPSSLACTTIPTCSPLAPASWAPSSPR